VAIPVLTMRSEASAPEDPTTLIPFQDEVADDGMDEWRQRVYGLQRAWEDSMEESRQRKYGKIRASLILAHCFALLSMIMVILWIRILDDGLSWEKGESSWHPLMMIAAFNFMTVASLSFRYRGLGTKRLAGYRGLGTRRLANILHGMAWTVAMLCVIVGLVAVFRSQNDEISGYIAANLYSMHSWMGIFVGVSYVTQFFAGLLTFDGFPLTSLGIFTPSFKAKMLTVHNVFEPIIQLRMMLRILLVDIQIEGEGYICYEVDEADLAPWWKQFVKIPELCKVSYLMGVLVMFTGVCTSFAWEPESTTLSGVTTERIEASKLRRAVVQQ
jgi:uncharacterized membrane protein